MDHRWISGRVPRGGRRPAGRGWATVEALESRRLMASGPLPGAVAIPVVATAGTPTLGVTNSELLYPPEYLPVATFPVSSADPGPYQATVDWGDGTALGAATIVGPMPVGGVPTDDVIATHTFAAPGVFDGSVTIRASDGSTATLPLRSTVNGFTAVGNGYGFTFGPPTAGTTTGPIQVATFQAVPTTGHGTPSPESDFYSALVNWGDGTPTEPAMVVGSGVTIFNDGPPYIAIQAGGHIYAAPGDYKVTYTLSDAGLPDLADGSFTEAVGTFEPRIIPDIPSPRVAATAGTPVAPAPLIDLTTGPVLGGVGEIPAPLPSAADYSATVDWGDGTPASAATFTALGFGNYEIATSGHTYAAPGSYTITYTVGDAGAPDVDRGTVPATVGAPTFTPSPAPGTTSPPGAPIALGTLTGTVPAPVNSGFGPFAQPALALRAGGYSATIDYGDGSGTEAGTLVQDSDGTLTVEGPGHAFAAPGTYQVAITIGTAGQPTLATFATTITVSAAPIQVSGQLDPASDSGVSDSDGITDDATPRFLGTTAPMATVRVFATSPTFAVTPLGQVVADANGQWSLTSAHLPDGAYFITATATDRFGVATASQGLTVQGNTLPFQQLVIDTVGPKLTGFAVTDPKTGRFRATFVDDRSGLVASQLVDGSNYAVTRPDLAARPSQDFPVSSLSATAAASPTAPVAVTGSIFDGRSFALRAGQYAFDIRSAGITDVAGNPLEGEFHGRFPTGNGLPGGDFVARVDVAGSRASAPLPVTPALALELAKGEQDPPPKPRKVVAAAHPAKAKLAHAAKAPKPAARGHKA